MKHFLLTLLLLIAPVTMYGATGNRMANGDYPYVGAAACPRSIPLGTRIKILDIPFLCADRTNLKYNGRYDLFSQGTKAQMLKFGKQKLEVEIIK